MLAAGFAGARRPAGSPRRTARPPGAGDRAGGGRNPGAATAVQPSRSTQESAIRHASSAALPRPSPEPVIDERVLVHRAASGDEAAFESLVAAHASFVYNLARRTLGHDDEADDAAQEAFLRAWRGLPRFDGRSAFRTWLYRIAVRVCLDRRPGMLRRLTELADAPDAVDDVDAPRPDPSPTPEGAVERQAARRRVRRAVDALPEGYRLLVTLHYLQELSYDEVAALTGMPLGSLKVALHRARARLRAALDESPGTDAVSGAAEVAR